MNDSTKFVIFRTPEQAAIFDCELTGQFSDGHWENTPGAGWKDWCSAKVAVAAPGQPVGRSFLYTKKDNYGLTNSFLLSVVGQRMIGYARLARALGFEKACELHDLIDCDGKIDVVAPDLTDPNGYWDKQRARIAALPHNVREIIADESYGMKDLLKDLREISKTMKTVLPPETKLPEIPKEPTLPEQVEAWILQNA